MAIPENWLLLFILSLTNPFIVRIIQAVIQDIQVKQVAEEGTRMPCLVWQWRSTDPLPLEGRPTLVQPTSTCSSHSFSSSSFFLPKLCLSASFSFCKFHNNKHLAIFFLPTTDVSRSRARSMLRLHHGPLQATHSG